VTYPSTGYGTVRLAVGNFNGDRFSDIVAANVQQSDINVFLANHDGTLQNAMDYTVSPGPIWMTLADFNGDGAVDLAVANEYGSDISVLLNTGGTEITLTSSPNPSRAGRPVRFTATVAPGLPGQPVPTGTVTFRANGRPLGTASLVNGTAKLKYSGLAAGKYRIRARYSGDAQFNPNSSSELRQVVRP
jgi:hypothetical protein